MARARIGRAGKGDTVRWVTSAFEWIETRLDQGLWFRRALAVTTMLLAFQLTAWGARYAERALTEKADLMAVAAIIGAVAGIPIAFVTLLFNKYVETRQ